MKEISKDSATKWTEKNLPDLTGKTIIITGANSGTGFAATKFMSAMGAVVIMACRNPEKAKKALQSIKNENPGAKLDFIQLDLGDLASVKQFSEAFKKKYASLDILINNAGVAQTPDLKTKDGFEMQIGINHLGHFALTKYMMERLINTKDSRVVTVGSMNGEQGEMNFDNLFFEGEYQAMPAYNQSKLATHLFAYELGKRFADAGLSVESLAANPGFIKSNILKENEYTQRSFGFKLMFGFIETLLAMSPDQGSLPIMRAATDRTLKNGDFVSPTKIGGMRGLPKLVTLTNKAYNDENAKRLWEMSEELTDVKYIF
ncbi:MAG: SDR family NAD(P)-dependent oxidoreductase [Chloroflexi bacterium]|nr:SDR family NAD(P)-dependent oxidoreductase [Chloroflexota bacterium]